jgi:hypothetical protein
MDGFGLLYSDVGAVLRESREDPCESSLCRESLVLRSELYLLLVCDILFLGGCCCSRVEEGKERERYLKIAQSDVVVRCRV